MEKIKVIVDSTCDLNPEDIKKHNISILPLYVTFNEEVYQDGVDITIQELYDKVAEKDELPKTSARNPGDYVRIYKQFIDEGYKIISFTISSDMSSTYQSACLAAKEFKEGMIHVVDSRNLSSGIGLLILKACKFIEEGMKFEDVCTNVENLKPNVRSQFSVETLDYLHKGGRCSSTARFFGKMLRMHPVIVVRDGKMSVDRYPLGKSVKGWNALLDILKEDMAAHEIDYDHIMITHSIAPEGEAYLKEELAKIVPPECIMVTHAGSVISSHCGAGTIGILYIIK